MRQGKKRTPSGETSVTRYSEDSKRHSICSSIGVDLEYKRIVQLWR